MAEDYTHVSRARSLRGALALGLTWGGAVFVLLVFGAMPVIVLLLVLAGAPLAWDMMRDRQSWFKITDAAIAWDAPSSSGELALEKLVQAHVTFRLDLSAKLGLRLEDGRLITVPLSCLPGPHTLERILLDRGIRVVRGRQPLG